MKTDYSISEINNPLHQWKRFRVGVHTKSVTIRYDGKREAFSRKNLIANGYGPEPVDTSSGIYEK